MTESPRWLLSKQKREAAIKSLDRIRPAEDVQNGLTTQELEALEQAIEDAKHTQSGSWLDLFRGTYLRRTMVSGR